MLEEVLRLLRQRNSWLRGGLCSNQSLLVHATLSRCVPVISTTSTDNGKTNEGFPQAKMSTLESTIKTVLDSWQDEVVEIKVGATSWSVLARRQLDLGVLTYSTPPIQCAI